MNTVTCLCQKDMKPSAVASPALPSYTTTDKAMHEARSEPIQVKPPAVGYPLDKNVSIQELEAREATSDTQSSVATPHSNATKAREAENDSELSRLEEILPRMSTPLDKHSFTRPSDGVDSGYASLQSTPDGSKHGFEVEAVHRPKGLLPSLTRKKIKLKAYDKPIPQFTKIHFNDLVELHEDSLNRLTRGLTRCQGISMSLKVLGENEESASPWIFVQCDKRVAKNVRAFFKQPEIRRDFQPTRPDRFSPYFDIHVCELPPKPLLAQGESSPLQTTSNTIEIFVESPSDQNLRLSLIYGKTIMTQSYGVQSKATLGGFIEIVDENGQSDLFGLTAGHFLSRGGDDEDVEELEYEVMDDDIADDLSDLGDTFEIDSELFEDVDALPSLSSLDLTSEEVPTEITKDSWRYLGSVHEMSQKACQNKPNLDWALIKTDSKIGNPKLFGMDSIVGQNTERSHSSFAFRSEQRVVVAAGTSGKKYGVLATSWAYIMLAPGQILTKTYLLTLDNKESLQTGDSGALVVDFDSPEVFGYVVASELFGGAYVIPLRQTLDDIQSHLSARAVFFSISAEEIEEEDELRINLDKSHREDIKWSSSPHTVSADSGYSTMENTPVQQSLLFSPSSEDIALFSMFHDKRNLLQATEDQDHRLVDWLPKEEPGPASQESDEAQNPPSSNRHQNLQPSSATPEFVTSMPDTTDDSGSNQSKLITRIRSRTKSRWSRIKSKIFIRKNISAERAVSQAKE